MRKYRLKRYLGIVFIAVVIAPAIALSLIALRAISHEEAYIEKQIEGTLSAEVAHVTGVVTTELDRIQIELAGTIVIPEGPDAAAAFDEWKQRSPLVEIPFLLSPEHEILWPTAAPPTAPAKAEAKSAPDDEAPSGTATSPYAAEPSDAATLSDAAASPHAKAPTEKEISFLREQQAFLEDEEPTPVYENIAEAYKDDILSGVNEAEETVGEEITRVDAVTQPEEGDVILMAPRGNETARRTVPIEESVGKQASARLSSVGSSASDKDQEQEVEYFGGEKARAQKAVSQFEQSEPVRQRVYDKAEQEGQQFAYRNVQVDDAEAKDSDRWEERGVVDTRSLRAGADEPAVDVGAVQVVAGAVSPEERPSSAKQTEPESLGRIRSIFISQPRNFSDIVSQGESGIVPRTIDGGLQLLYWQKAVDGNIVGCLIKSDELRDRLIGILPGIYSSVRILTILDEKGRPLIVPPGQEERDWRRPLAAGEISELLPSWEVASYLTDPNVISSRAQVATSLMWMLIVILFVAILVGGTLVVRSTYSEMRLAQQKTSFVANVSHELKTPLTSIRLFAEMLRDGRQHDEAKQKQYLDIMAAETERLTRLVNNVLDFSRMERGEKRYTLRRCDLIAVCADVVETQRARLENNGFEVVFTTHTGSLLAQADEEALKQALVNLISNAEKYSPDTKQIEIDVRQDDERAVIAVSDRGVGIPAREAERIFDEFYRVDDDLTSRVKGAGLGLTIARRILKGHGGDLKYSRREGGGSTFELIIPRPEEQA